MKRERVTSQVIVETLCTPIGTVELERNCSIDVDAFESPKHLKRSAGECEGYTVTFAEGNSPHTYISIYSPQHNQPSMGVHIEKWGDEVVCSQLSWCV